MVTQQQARSANFGPSWPEVAGFGAAGPNKQSNDFAVWQNHCVQASVKTLALLAGLAEGGISYLLHAQEKARILSKATIDMQIFVWYIILVLNVFSTSITERSYIMQSDNVKDQLIQATMKLLTESKNPSKVTARQIASEADANLAMINYYFSSKDELVNIAVNKLMADRANELKEIRDSHIPAKQKLTEFLITMSDIVTDFSELTKPTIPYSLLEGEIELPYYILPMIKEYCEDKRSETECRIIAYQFISFSQLVFYRSSDFLKYTGIDISDKKQRDTMFQTIVDIFINV